jgi:hypothetical protein
MIDLQIPIDVLNVLRWKQLITFHRNADGYVRAVLSKHNVMKKIIIDRTSIFDITEAFFASNFALEAELGIWHGAKRRGISHDSNGAEGSSKTQSSSKIPELDDEYDVRSNPITWYDAARKENIARSLSKTLDMMRLNEEPTGANDRLVRKERMLRTHWETPMDIIARVWNEIVASTDSA